MNQDRGYVRLEKRRFVPEDRGRLTVAFLQAYFENYMHYDFTAKMEETLDDISNGKINWKKVIQDFWHTFIAKIEAMENVTFDDVRATLHKSLGKFVFKSEDEK